jgi:hypothetical protein
MGEGQDQGGYNAVDVWGQCAYSKNANKRAAMTYITGLTR